MLKALLKVRMRAIAASMFRRGTKKRSAASGGMMILLIIWVLASLMVAFGGMFSVLCEPLCNSGLAWVYFAVMATMASALCFIGSVFLAQAQLFEAKDNDLLLSMPITPRDILASRMLSLLLYNYLYCAIIVLPAVFIYCRSFTLTPVGAVLLVLSVLLLPLLLLAISCLFGWLIAAVSARLRNAKMLTTILSTALLLAYCAVYARLQSFLTQIAANGEAVGETMHTSLYPLYLFGRAAADGDIGSFLLFVLCTVIPFMFVYWLLSRRFIAIATAKRGSTFAAYTRRPLREGSAEKALLRREIRHFSQSPMYIMNAALGLIFMVVAGVAILLKKADFIAALPPEATTYLTPLVAVILNGCAAMVTIAAPSISLEGKSFWLSRALPLDGAVFLRTKANCQIVLSLPFIAIAGTLCVIALQPPFVAALLLYAMPAVTTVLFAYLGVTMNLQFPRLDYPNEVAAVKQSASVMLAMLLALLLAALPILVFFFVQMPAVPFAWCCTLVYAVLAYLLRRYLCTKGVRIWESL